MKKIGILTFHGGINYGGTLQAYALYTFLKQQGYDVEIIDFAYPKGRKTIKGKLGQIYRGIVSILEPIIHHETFSEKRKSRIVFRDFLVNNTTLSSKLYLSSLEKHCSGYSAIITGSDQIWNSSGHYHGAYFLAPLKRYFGLRISYSPCCAQNVIQDTYKNQIREALLKYDSISVRNIETQNFVESLIKIKTEIVLDPVFLISFADRFRSTNLENIPDRYIFVYILGQDIAGGSIRLLEEIRKGKGTDLKIVVVASSNCSDVVRNCADILLTSISPADWVYLIRNANYVYTNSFHAMVFAINFKIEFLAFYREKVRASRFIYMAEKFNLDKHIVTSLDEVKEKGSIYISPNFNDIEKLIEEERIKSIAFIYKSLNGLRDEN